MKLRALPSVGAVLLYVYCEFTHVSPFAGYDAMIPSGKTQTALPKDEARESLTELFGPSRLDQ